MIYTLANDALVEESYNRGALTSAWSLAQVKFTATTAHEEVQIGVGVNTEDPFCFYLDDVTLYDP